jgi:cell division protein FtsB
MGKRGEKTSLTWLVCLIAFLSIFVLSAFGYASYHQIQKKKQVEDEISKLEEEAEKIKKENLSLEDRLAYFKSDDYKKIQAKEKLNLRDPKEELVMVAPEVAEREPVSEPIAESVSLAKEISHKANYEKWLAYFFE